MSNDLISRSAFKELLVSYGCLDAAALLDDFPTAYDVEKVVKHMENEAKRWQESGEEYQDEKELGVAEGFKRAVNIVKAGGVNENN